MSRLVFGVQPVREVLRAHGNRVETLWLAGAPPGQAGELRDGENPKLAGLHRLAESCGVVVTPTSRHELERMSKGGMHQGAAALAPDLKLIDHEHFMKLVTNLEAPPTVVILDGIMDPQNFGAVVRSAVALGAPFVVWPEHGSAPLTPATFRASAGAVEHATLVRVPSLPPLIHDLKQVGFTVVLLEGGSDTALESVQLSGPVAIVVGAEDRGAKPAVKKATSVRAHVPMTRAIDSLNASVACALALYEVGRQRRASNDIP